MSEQEMAGVLNPAYDEEDENMVNSELDESEPEVQITRFGGRDPEPNEALEKRTTYIVPNNKGKGGKQKETVLDIILNEQVTHVDDTRRAEKSMNNNADNISITISEEFDKKKGPVQGPSEPAIMPSSNRSNSVKMHSKLARSLSKTEIIPPLDADYLRSTHNFSEKQIKGRQLLYMKMGPMTDEDQKWLEWVEIKFKDIAGADGKIDLDEFKKALGVKKSFFAVRFFELFDQDCSGTIELVELMDGLRMLTKGTPAQKLQFLFDVFDADASGSIERGELQAVLRACMEESALSLTDENVEDLTDVLFNAADEDESGAITFNELRAELEKHPGVIENLTISAAQWLKPPENSADGYAFRYFTKDYWTNNIRKVGYVLIYWTLNIMLFALAMWQYRDSNTWIMVARGCGLCLNFNCMWVLVLMLRKSLTFLRMTKLCVVLPLDQSICFHKMTAYAIVMFVVVHTLAHIANAAIVGDALAMEMWEVLFTTKAGVGFVGGSAFITGWLLDIILIVMVICSMEFVRRGGHFKVFYWTHMLYVPFWILVLLHGPNFWMWFVGPGIIFILEKISRSKLMKIARYGDMYIEAVNLLPSGVTHLIITKPTNFRYRPGDYLFLQIPEIASHEWHPFTISSAPEMEGHIWLHIRSAGHWTNKLYKYFDTMEAPDGDDIDSVANSRQNTTRRKFEQFERAYSRPRATITKSNQSTRLQKKQKHKVVKVKCYVDGPYGTGTREVFDTSHVVLVGAGIGVTPMASILQSVWYRFNATRQQCPSCQHVWFPEDELCYMKLKKVDFIWINRDQKSFEWFLTLLNQIELEQGRHHGPLENCIHMHMYMTAAQKKTDMKGIGLQIALDLMYDKSQRDLITGLRTKTEPGRPDWDEIFKSVKAEHKGKVKIFFCGPTALGKIVREKSEKYKFSFSKENF